MFIANASVSGVILFLSSLTALLSMTSPNTFWALVGQFQLMMLVPMLGGYLHDDVVKYCVGVDYSLFSFSFIPNLHLPGVQHALEYLDYKQEDEYLKEIDLESASSVVNLFKIFQTLSFIVILHLVYLLVFKVIQK